ncbi:MAG: hypothetical protein CMO33_02240 [Verrucomicrobia bacterium]|nr:hypothetical protein [Verrucomicrobiota bacterium]
MNFNDYGLMATFKSAKDIYHACLKVREAGYTKWESYTPFPVHGLDKAMGMTRSHVPRFTLIGGLTGFTLATLMIWFMNAYDYPLNVGGKPFFTFIFPFPVMYEMNILLAAFGTLGGMFILNRLPRHHHPLFENKNFLTCSDDRLAIVIEVIDPKYDEEETKKFLESLNATEVEIVQEDN